MSDAWNAKGWTAQQAPWYYVDDSTPGAWKLPADVDLVTVTGTFGDIDGGRAMGWVMFEANASLIHTATKTTLAAPRFIAVISQDGTFTVRIPATDTAALVSAAPPFLYHATVVLGRKVADTFTFDLPLATPTVDLIDLHRVV